MQTPDILAQAVAIAEAASALPMGHFRTPLPVEAKEDDSPVTIADRATEAFIRDRLREAFPQDGIFGEEMGVENGAAEALWIIDPIDGTRSFITGNPLFGMLLGRVVAGVPQIGIVRMPALGETFAGMAGGGATLNGAAIRCRTTTRLDGALVYINEAEKIHAADPARFARLCGIGHTRRMAYDCYPHALVAAGHEIIAVYTRAPKPAGRGKQLQHSPVHVRAEALGIDTRALIWVTHERTDPQP